MLCCSCFRGIVNWLGCFDVVAMREGGWWERLAKAPYNSSPFYFWPMRDLCWRAVKRNETWWNRWEMTQIWSPNAEYSSVGETQAIFFLFSPAEGLKSTVDLLWWRFFKSGIDRHIGCDWIVLHLVLVDDKVLFFFQSTGHYVTSIFSFAIVD